MAAFFSFFCQKYKTDPPKKERNLGSVIGVRHLISVSRVGFWFFLGCIQERLLSRRKVGENGERSWGKPPHIWHSWSVFCRRWERKKSAAKAVNVFSQVEVVMVVTSAFWPPIKVKWPPWAAKEATGQIPTYITGNPLKKARGVNR